MHMNLIKLKVKSKSLAAEAAIIRKEMRKLAHKAWDYRSGYGSLHYHLKEVVGVEARATFMARAYLTNKTFATIEKNVWDQGDKGWKSLGINNLDNFSSYYDKENHQKAALKRAKEMVKKYQWKDSPRWDDFDNWVKLD